MNEEGINNHEMIVFQLGELKGTIQGMVTQLSIANGRTSKSEAKIDILEKRADQQDGALKAIADLAQKNADKKKVSISIWSAVVATVGGVIGLIGFLATYWSKFQN